jgi:hypothetical protein
VTPEHQRDLHRRIAEATGWSVEDVRSFGLRMLREVVRPKHPELAAEIQELVVSGRHVEITPVLSPAHHRCRRAR